MRMSEKLGLVSICCFGCSVPPLVTDALFDEFTLGGIIFLAIFTIALTFGLYLGLMAILGEEIKPE